MLRPFALRMLYDGPKNGAELMDAIESMTRGRWRPSPGSVYPLLDELTKDNLVRKRDDGRYELTAEARAEFGPWNRAEPAPRGVEPTLEELEGYASYLEEVAQAGGPEWSAAKPRLASIASRLRKLAEA